MYVSKRVLAAWEMVDAAAEHYRCWVQVARDSEYPGHRRHRC